MSVFPLQKLPFVALSHELKCMSIQDLLNLSKDSSKMRKIIKRVGIRSGGYNINIDGFGWMLSMVNGSYGTNRNEQNKLDSIGTLLGSLEHLQTLFPGTVNTLAVCKTMAESLMVYEQFLPKDCNMLIVKSEFDSELCEINREDPYHHSWFSYLLPDDFEKQRVIKEEEQQWLHQFLGSISFKYGLVLQGPGRPKIGLERISHVDYFKVDYSDWMTFDELDLLHNRIIYLDRSMFSNEAVNDYLMKFKSGAGHSQLEILTIKGYDQDPEWDEDDILEGLGAKRWDPKERDQRFFINESNSTKLSIISNHIHWKYDTNCGFNLENAHDFICEDGTLCSVLIEGSKMQLFVWKKETSDEKEQTDRPMESDDAPEVKRRRAE